MRSALRARVAPCRSDNCVLDGDWAVSCPEHPGDTVHCHHLADALNQGTIHILRHRRMEENR